MRLGRMELLRERSTGVGSAAMALLRALSLGFLHPRQVPPRLTAQPSALKAAGQTDPQLIAEESWLDPVEEAEDYKQVAFTLAAIALCAKLARCDAPVSPVEYAAFRKAFPMPATEKKKIWHLFREASYDTQPPGYYARQIRQLYGKRRALMEDTLSRLFAIAVADQKLQESELQCLHEIACGLGISRARFQTVMRRHAIPHSTNPYEVLGVRPQLSNAELKAVYRRLMREYHPDGLAACGVSEDMLMIAAARVRQINEAYDRILRMRGLK